MIKTSNRPARHITTVGAILSLLLGLALFNISSGEQQRSSLSDFTGLVVGISDGDTIRVLDSSKTEIKVRLSYIDAPESGQPFGSRAKQLCSELCYSKTVTVQVTGIDRYGRTLGWVVLPDKSVLNERMVQAGLAWWYEHFDQSNEYRLRESEQAARSARLGLWQDPIPVAPWIWRKTH